MSRQKGDGLGRLGGRTKGTPNKVTAEKKARIAAFMEGNWEKFEEAFKQLTDPKEICQTYLAMMPYYAPKLASVDYKEKAPAKTYKDELDEISGEKTR